MPEVVGAIREKWLAFGGESFFGPALDVERPTFDGVGRAQPFGGGGIITWHPAIGAFAVWGQIGQKWQALGREQYGYPTTDESPCADGVGRFNHFQAMQLPGGPRASIYWSPASGVHEVHGEIWISWSQNDFERGPLGYPTSDEHGNGSVRRNDFQHGFIDWNARDGARVHGPVKFDD